MDEKSLYAHILNLSDPWQVKSLSLDENAGSVTVTIEIAENTRLACPTCGKSCSVHDHRHRKWRHLDTCQFTTIVEADVPRIMCPEHGCLTLPVPWAGPGSRYRGLRANDVKNHVNRLTYCFILIIRCCIYSYSNDHGADGRWNAIPSRLIA